MSDTALRDQIVRVGRSLYDRGLTFGAAGNISVRTTDGWLMTPTGVSLGSLEPEDIAKLNASGQHVAGLKPTKESFLHQEFYRSRPQSGAVVHLHASHSVAVSCMSGLDTCNVLPPLTAYYIMRVGRLPLIPYFAPGDVNLAKAVGEMASRHHAVLLANHGPVVSGDSLLDALYATEELEETAKLFLLLRGQSVSTLTDPQIEDLGRRFTLEL